MDPNDTSSTVDSDVELNWWDSIRFHDVLGLQYQVFLHDVTAAILVLQNNKKAAMLVSQTNPVRVKLFSRVNNFFCSHKFALKCKCWPRECNRSTKYLPRPVKINSNFMY